MAVLLTGVGLLALSFFVQLAVWRMLRPQRQLRALLILYTIVPLLACTVAWTLGRPVIFSGAEVVRIVLFYVSLSLAYFVAHCAIDSGSPTLDIIGFVAKAGPAGCSDAELSANFGPLVMADRIALVEHGGMMQADRDVFRLSIAGRFYARLFDEASRIFGLPRGG